MSTEPTPDRPRRRLRIGIRGLMIVILAMALGLGYMVNRAREQRLAVSAVREAGGFVHYTDEYVMGRVNVPPGNSIWKPGWGKLTSGKGSWAPEWLRSRLGDEYFREVAHVSLFVDTEKGMATAPNSPARPYDDILQLLGTQSSVRTLQVGGETVTDKGLDSIARMTGLQELTIWWATGITDAGLAKLNRMPNLRLIDISLFSSLTDDSIVQLAKLPNLEHLSIHGVTLTDKSLMPLARAKHLKLLNLQSNKSKIGDDGLAALRDVSTLTDLVIDAPNVTDKGLEHLKGLKGLQQLHLGGSAVTKEGREKLLKAIPNLKFSS